jgi:hypothetical protein
MKMEVIESEGFRESVAPVSKKPGPPHYSGKSHYVDENKWCKNVRFGACHYVDENTST